MSKPKQSNNKTVEEVVGPIAVPTIYINGFQSTVSHADVVTVLTTNGQPVAVLNMSYTIAKTMVMKLGGLIDRLESASENTIMTTDDMNIFLEKFKGPDNV